jgi:hypothetical protein
MQALGNLIHCLLGKSDMYSERSKQFDCLLEDLGASV